MRGLVGGGGGAGPPPPPPPPPPPLLPFATKISNEPGLSPFAERKLKELWIAARPAKAPFSLLGNSPS
jgi:hypothetical protein